MIFNQYRQLPRNIWVLAGVLALVQSGIPLLVFIGGILATEVAPMPSLATLPLAITIVGLALTTVPAAAVSQRLGRKGAAYLGLLATLVAMLVCALAAWQRSFGLLLLGSVLTGAGGAVFQQFRFAALESLHSPEDAGPALSVLMMGGIVAGILGPELGTIGTALLPSAGIYGAPFLLMAVVVMVAILCLGAFVEPQMAKVEAGQAPMRPLGTMVLQPLFLLAMAASLTGFAVMSFLMTATPISMHVMHGHDLAATKWVIQSHIVAMYLPSIICGPLMKIWGLDRVMLTGALLYGLMQLVASLGHELTHYWWSLVLLGVGWNFLFMSGTSLLPQTYRPEERFRAQAFNDFCIFGFQAVSSLSAGWLLYRFGWNGLLWISAPFTVLMVLASLMYVLRRGAPTAGPSPSAAEVD